MKKKNGKNFGEGLPATLEAEEAENSSEAHMESVISDSCGNYGDPINHSWHREADAGEKVLENVDMGGVNDFVMGDLIDVVSDDLLEFK